MKRLLSTLVMLGVFGTTGTAVYADNPDVEDALRRRPDLSVFYQALINTGVNHELRSGATYTIFAPTNTAMARIRQDQYPCFYMSECRAQVAQIVRNHIVPGEVYIDDASHRHGGLYAINGHFVPVGETRRDDYIVDGQPVVYTSWYGSGILYKIDGIIASPREMASLQSPDEYAYYEPQQVTTTTVERRSPISPVCQPGECTEAVTRTTTVTRTVPDDAPVTPMLEPAR